jgi:pSer/pThr/pTyr-binding forkhead associated (FHA) protein
MATITLRIIDGADRGRYVEGAVPPITIGREEGNTIQLNDDRVSRYHIKIQEDHDKIVLTDLDSTNGTLVNGEETQIRILRYGDMITVGRTVLLFGSRDEIAERLASLRDQLPELGTAKGKALADEIQNGISLDFELNWSKDPELQSTLHTLEPPKLPERLDAVQAAQLSELIEFMHIRVRQLIATVGGETEDHRVTLDLRQWQNLLDVQARLAVYLNDIGNQG